MASKLVSRENVHVILGVIMIICLPLTMVTLFLALILLIGRPIGNMAIATADVFASIFSVAFFAAFVLAMAGQRSRDS